MRVSSMTLPYVLPRYLSSDNDPLFQYHQWQANLRILEIEPIKSIPPVPVSHPFVERLIGSIRRELLDHTFFWTATNLKVTVWKRAAGSRVAGKMPALQIIRSSQYRGISQYSRTSQRRHRCPSVLSTTNDL